MKVIIPGARCDDLFLKLADLNRSYIFEEIIVHVGTNYLGKWSDAAIIGVISEFLTSARKFLPDATNLTFSPIMPRRCVGNRPFAFVNSINIINGEIDYMIEKHGINIVNYDCFHDDGYLFRLLGKDGIHLNRTGVSAVSVELMCHQKFLLKH